VSCGGNRSGTGASVVGMTSEADKIFLEKAGSFSGGRSHEVGPISLFQPT